jgi:hypothetical protein
MTQYRIRRVGRRRLHVPVEEPAAEKPAVKAPRKPASKRKAKAAPKAKAKKTRRS